MNSKTKKSIKPVYVPEDFNIEESLPAEQVPTRPIPEKKMPKRLFPASEEAPRSYSPRNLNIGTSSFREAASKEGALRTVGFQLNHAIESRGANYFHVTSKTGHDAYVKIPNEERETFDPKEMSPRTRGFLVPAKKTTAVHYPLDMREKALKACAPHCLGVAIHDKERSAITFVESGGYDTHFFQTESNIPLPIVHFDSVAREEEGIHETIAKAAYALAEHAMKVADAEVNAFLEMFSQTQKLMLDFSNHCDEIVMAYTSLNAEEAWEDRLTLIRKYTSIARKIEGSKGAFVELQEVIENLSA